MHQNTDWEKEAREEFLRFYKKLPYTPSEHKYPDQRISDWWLSKLQAREEEIREVLKSFRDDGEGPTETGLLIENILARLNK